MTIKEFRQAARMTQKGFSEYLNIPVRTIQDWEGKRRNPPQYLVELVEYKIKKEKLNMKKYLQINEMRFELNNGEEITSIQVEKDVIRIEGFTPDREFITTYYPDRTVSEWRGYGKGDIWTSQENYNIIKYDIVKD